MMSRAFPVIVGLAGLVVLIWLGVWQLQRMAWKNGILAEIDRRVEAAPTPLPAQVSEAEDEYRPVRLSGRFTGTRIFVLTSIRGLGPGFRVIEVFETEDNRQILVDRGYLPEAQRGADLDPGAGAIVGNLLWPDETDRFTPAPEGDLWFTRDAPAMAEALGAEPFLVVAVTGTDARLTPLPVDTSTIPNTHLNYAITWLLLAVVWAAMTGYWVWRQRRSAG